MCWGSCMITRPANQEHKTPRMDWNLESWFLKRQENQRTYRINFKA